MKRTVTRLVDAVVDKYLTSSVRSVSELIDCERVRSVALGRRARPALRHRLESRIYAIDPQPNDQELELITLLSYGEECAFLAEKCAVSKRAMQTRLYRMRLLFQVDSNAELVGIALRRGWIA